MNFSPQELHNIYAASATGSSSSTSSSGATATGAGSAMPADPNTMLISSIANAVDSIFGTIGDAVKGKTKKDLMRQQGNQQLIESSMNLHRQRMGGYQPKAKKKDNTGTIVLIGVGVLVFTIIIGILLFAKK